MKKLLFYVGLISIFFLPSLASAGSYFVQTGYGLQIINEKVATSYFNRTQTSIYTVQFETDASQISVVIPCQFNPQFSKISIDLINTIDEVSKPSYKLNQLNQIKSAEQKNVSTKPKTFESFNLELISPNSNTYLDSWLIKNGFPINNNIKSALYEYQQNNMYFVVAKLDLRSFPTTTYFNLHAGYIAPIKVSFQTNRPIIPEKMFFSFYQNEKLPNYQHPTKFTFYNFFSGQTEIDKTKIERSNWLNKNDLLKVKPILNLPDSKVFLTRSIKLTNYNDEIGDLTIKQSAKNQTIGSSDHGHLETSAWILIIFTLFFIIMIFSPFGILFYLSALLIHYANSIIIKYIYFSLLLLSFLSTSVFGFYSIVLSYRFSNVIIDTMLGLFKYDIKLIEIRYSLMIVFCLLTITNLVIIFLAYRNIINAHRNFDKDKTNQSNQKTSTLDIIKKQI